MVVKPRLCQFRKSRKSNNKYIWLIYSLQSDDSEYLLGVLPGKLLQRFGDSDVFLLSEAEGSELVHEITQYAWNRLINYLSLRERSEAECVSYLKGLSLEKGAIQTLIEKGKQYNYINDDRFADLLVASYVNRNKSRVEIKNSLYEKKINPQIIERSLKNNYPEDEGKRVVFYHIEKGIKKYPDRSSYKDYQRCISYLMRKGFAFEDFREELYHYYMTTEEY
jgi:SOS response regulatory protein OraA/RecX